MTTDQPNPAGPPPELWQAILLTGGRGSRLGQMKSGVVLGGRTLLDHVLSGLPDDVAVIVVGPAELVHARPVTFTTESPVGGGPVAGLAAGLELADAMIVGVIATDMPFAGGLLAHLAQGIPPNADALVPVDATGQRQPLCAAYRTSALRRAVRALGDVNGASMHSLIAHLTVVETQSPDSFALHDIDTPADLDHSRAIMRQMKGTT